MDAGNQSPPEASARRGVLLTIFLTVFIDLLGFSIIFPLFPAMLEYYLAREETGGVFHGLIDQLRAWSGESSSAKLAVLFGGVLGSLYATLQFVFAPLWGRLSDRAGRRPILLFTISGTAASYLLWFVSGSFPLLIAARFLGGMMSGNIAVATAAIADVTTPANRARGMALVGIALGLGFTFGPAIGAGLSGIDLARELPSLAAWGVNPFSAAAGGAFLLSLINLVSVIRRFPETLAPARHPDPEAPQRTANLFRLFSRQPFPGVDRVNLVYFIFFVAFSGMEFTLVFLAQDRLGFDAHKIAIMFVYIGLLMALVQGGVVRRLAPRFGEKSLAIAGLALLLPGFLLTGRAESVSMLYGGLTFLAAGGALATPCLSALASLYTPASHQGEVLGVFRSLGALARAVAPVAACYIYWRHGSGAPYTAGAVLLLVPLLLALGLPQPKKEGSEN